MIIISPPFGNYLRFPGCIHTLGTFTLKPRSDRLWRLLKTVRYNWRQQSWINKLGLPNPGIRSLKKIQEEDIVSLHGFNADEWVKLVQQAPPRIELNLSCPNVDHKHSIDALREALRIPKQQVICKLPPIRWMDFVRPLYDLGVRQFHCCNTIPTPGGGISGKPLKQYSLWAIEEIRSEFPDIILTGGGGVDCVQDVKDYMNAGANHVSVGSILFFPWKWSRIATFVEDS